MTALIATYVPVSTEILLDASIPNLGAYIGRSLHRRLIAAIFGESWSTPARELERLEFGAPVEWDEVEEMEEDDE